ncbi:uncharacterized protein (DUF58 family) [Spinactinospora alkalitolerans]|uniref:Uncharacterized protein (DUF58 family) n=1 Tax=Spinactinospora alkalitolerans TaxID=687207 RepID=A0A852TTU9_9ACTN|nr:DUF58 domain-containing protein [Spinactinospora alkalitolerans]NYE47358.1 uncharacterized protein (DUF58 family) [Spinactinospora alkalitolerans]
MNRRPAPIDPRSHAALRRLDLRVVRRLEGLLHGEHLGLRPGPGSEPAEARLYQPGEDDVRHMDWSVTARTTTPHVRDLVADRELESWTLLDLSASMDFGTAATEKRDVAIGALAAVNVLTQHIGDRFGAHFLHRGHIRRWPARSGKNALLALLSTAAAAPRTPAQTPAGPHDLPQALTDLARTRPRRGLRVVISDFLDTPAAPDTTPAWQRPLRQLANRHQTLAVEIVDPRELDLPNIGLVTMSDPETGRTREVHMTAQLRQRYAQAAAAQRHAIRTALRRCGVPHLTLRTDRDWIIDVARFVVQQRRTAHRLARHTPAVPR